MLLRLLILQSYLYKIQKNQEYSHHLYHNYQMTIKAIVLSRLVQREIIK